MANAVAAAVATDRKAIMRDKRAQGIAAMGLVTREGDRFRVATPSLRGRTASYEVWRDEAGKVRCSCLEYEEHAGEDMTFRCEHILAVKHSLLAKNSEAVTRQQPENAVAATAETTVALNTNTNASEKRETPKATKLVAEGARSEREQNEEEETVKAVEMVATASNVRSLAKHTNTEEQEMNRKQEKIAIAQATENDEMALSAEPIAPVVPLAFTNTLRALRQQIDPTVVKSREGWTDRQGNMHMVEYVEWHAVADILDRIVPNWSHSVRNVVQIGDMVAVTAAITIDGVTREGVGTGTAESEMGIKKAEHDALKRAAVKFGIARELYQRESEVIEKEGTAPQGQFPRDPLAKSMADLVTPKQLGMIRALAREASVDVEEECQSVLRCKTDELSKRAASSFIDHLKGLQQEAASGMRRAS
ncbi:MAG TPA: Rad52/Rad22 family DNA repair protein [Pyrinomonadaceae bacterium]|nr:Rad52/Rad22 family DNA repair protein [Pyrinomonadaceae bacterium]